MRKKLDQDQKRNSNLGHGGGGSSSSVLHLQESTSLEEEVAWISMILIAF